MTASFASRRVSGVTIIDVTGRITLGAPSHGLREAISGAMKDGATNILLNLAGVDYLDSSGIGELVGGVRSTKAQGVTLKLLGVSKRIQDLLKLTKVLPLFECFSDEAGAIAGFQ